MELNPRGGEIYAHLFENQRTGLARGLFWNIHVELERVELSGRRWDASFACDWLAWPIKRVGELSGMSLTQVSQPELVEASVYLVAEHHPVIVTELRLAREVHDEYRLEAAGNGDIEPDGKRTTVRFQLECTLKFGGIIVVPDNLSPRPSNSAEVSAALREFIATDDLRPTQQGARYLFVPTD